MKFGVRIGVLRQPWDKVYGEAARLGFNGVEMEVGPEYQKAEVLDAEKRAQIEKMMKATGVETSCVCIGGYWKWSPADKDPAVRAEAVKIMKQTLEACERLDTRCILAPLSNPNATPEEAVQRWIEFCKTIAPDAEKRRVTVGVEICTRPKLATHQDAKAIVDAVGAQYVQVYWDVANARHAAADPVEGIRFLGKKHLAHIHIKDIKLTPAGSKTPFTGCHLGEGVLDFAAICKAIKEVGYDGWLTLETISDADASASAKKNLEYLKSKL
jgi:D-psicose/D-tagatose/L-ribulose 3-epimerase